MLITRKKRNSKQNDHIFGVIACYVHYLVGTSLLDSIIAFKEAHSLAEVGSTISHLSHLEAKEQPHPQSSVHSS